MSAAPSFAVMIGDMPPLVAAGPICFQAIGCIGSAVLLSISTQLSSGMLTSEMSLTGFGTNGLPSFYSGAFPTTQIGVPGWSPGQTGTFNTEMLQLDLSGGGGVQLRESPTLPSIGQSTITQINPGVYRIDSFFDVFTELSLDGGQSWTPSQGSTQFAVGSGIPEPSTLCLLAAGMVAVSRRVRRNR